MSLLKISDPKEKHNEAPSTFVVGIDLGTTNSIISSFENGSFTVFKDNDNELIPSCITFKPNGFTVGLNDQAKDDVIIISSIKRIMGKNDSQISGFKEMYNLEFAIKDNMPALDIYNKLYSAVDISSMLLQHMKNIAESSQRDKISGAVITVPAYFDDVQRQATKNAAVMAGIKVMRLINEPTAAAIAYGLESKSRGNFIVYDLGGGTFDVSILSLEKGIFRVIGTNGDTELGGDDIDIAILKYLKLKYAFMKDIPNSLLKLVSKNMKEKINNTQNRCSERFGDNKIELSYEEIEEISLPLIKKTIEIMDETIRDSDIDEGEISNIILVGGSTRLKIIKKLLQDKYKIGILDDINPDLVVSQGAAIQAKNLSGTLNEDILLLDILPLSLGIETYGELVEKVMIRNTPIPSTAKKPLQHLKMVRENY